MDLLSFLGQAVKRKDRYEEIARNLANETGDLTTLEEEMNDRSEGLVRRLATDNMRFDEFEKRGADETVTAAMAGVILGGGDDRALNDQAFAASFKTMPYWGEFTREVQWSMNEGILVPGTFNPDDPSVQYLPVAGKEKQPLTKTGQNSLAKAGVLGGMVAGSVMAAGKLPTLGKSRPTSWDGVEKRTKNYLAQPAYSWYSYGEMDAKRRSGVKQMRRRLGQVKTEHCVDCIEWDSMGWTEIGSLPPPGERCQCLFNCRCFIEYR